MLIFCWWCELSVYRKLGFSQDYFFSKGTRTLGWRKYPILIKFIYSEKATKFCEISTVLRFDRYYIGQIYSGDFAKICGLLRIYELYLLTWWTKNSFKLVISLVAQETNVKLRNLKLKKSSSLVFFSHDLTCAHVKIRFTIIWPVAVQYTAAAAAVAASVVAVRWRRRLWQHRRHGSNRRCLGSRTSALYYARLKRVCCGEN